MAGFFDNLNRVKTGSRDSISTVTSSTGGSSSTGSQNKPGRAVLTRKGNSSGGWQRSPGQTSFGQTVELPDINTTRGLLARFYQMGSTNPAKAREGLTMFEQLRMDPSSVYFNPYTSYTNRALDNLRDLGLEINEINDDWFASNAWLKQYYTPTANTNSLSTKMTNRRASKEEKAAYYYNQLWMAEESTKKAEQEWADLQKELSYKAAQTDRPWSDDDLVNNIDWKKYPTLARMDETRRQGTPMELNRAVGYSKDALYGVIWAARNDGGTGDPYQDMINSALGVGNVYQRDDTLAAKLDPTSDSYAPYTVGSTMDKEREYFGVSNFTKEWIEENRYRLNSTDKEERANYISVLEADAETDLADEELEQFRSRLERKVKSGKDPEQAIDDMLESGLYPTLLKMDRSIKNGYVSKTQATVNTTRKVDYDRASLLEWARGIASEKDGQETGASYAESMAGIPQGEKDTTLPKITVTQSEPGEVDAVTGADIPVSQIRTVKPSTQDGTGSPVQETEDGKVSVNPETDVTGEATPEQETADALAGAPMLAAGEKRFFTFTDQQRKTMREWGQNVMEGYDMASDAGVLTDTEDAVLSTASAETEAVKEVLDTTPATTLADKSTVKTARANAVSMVSTQAGALRHDAAMQELPMVQEQIAALEGSIVATEDELDMLNMVRDAQPDWLIRDLVTINDDRANSRDRAQALLDIYRTVIGDPKYEYNSSDSEALSKAQAWADYLNSDGPMIETTYSGEDRDEDLRRLRSREQELQNTIDDTASDAAAFDDSKAWFDVTMAAYERARVDTSEIKLARGVSDYLYGMTIYQPTDRTGISPYQDLEQKGSTPGEIEARHTENHEKLLDAYFVRDQYIPQNGLTIPQDALDGLNREISRLERDEKDWEYYSLRTQPNFDSMAEEGRAAEQAWVDSNYYALHASLEDDEVPLEWGILADGIENSEDGHLLTDDEKQTYYYIFGRDGFEAAFDYYMHLYDGGVLEVRHREELEKNATAEVDSGFLGGAWANTKAIASAPLEAVAGTAMILNSLATGREYNQYNRVLDYGYYSQTVNQATVQSILDVNGTDDGNGGKTHNAWSQTVNGLYEILYNRGRSAVNAAAFSFLGGTGVAVLDEFAGAVPMAIGAASMSIADAKDRGASDGQAYAIGTATFFAESLSEAITVSNIKGIFDAEEVTGATIKDAVVNWLTSSGVEEMAGESITDIIENLTDENVMGALSNHADNVAQYMQDHPGASETEAEEAVRRNELGNLLHTAIISYLSPGLDVAGTAVRYTGQRMGYYRDVTRDLQERGYNVSIRETRKMLEGQTPAQTQSKQQTTQTPEAPTETVAPAETETATPVEADTAEAPAEVVNEDTAVEEEKLLDNAAVLESVRGTDAATQNEAIVKVLDPGSGETEFNLANAAAPGLRKLFGGQEGAISGVKAILSGAFGAGEKSELVTAALRNAGTSPSSEARKVIESKEFRAATPEQKATMLAATVEADSTNEAVRAEATKSVMEHRVARKEAEAIASGALQGAQPSVDAAKVASREARSAEAQLEEKQQEVQAAQESLKTAEKVLQNDPREGESLMRDAAQDIRNARTVEEEYTQKTETARKKEKAAKERANRDVEQAMDAVRKQAMAEVEQEDIARAEQEAKAAEQAQVQAEVEEVARVRQESADNASDADFDAYMEQNNPDATEEERQHVREIWDRIQTEGQQTQAQTEITPEQMSVEDTANRQKFLRSVGKKFGYNIVEVDEIEHNANGAYDRDTNTIRLRKGATVGDAMYFVLGHELTHITEQAGEYNQLANRLLGMFYGENTTWDGVLADLNEGKANSPLAREVLNKLNTYQKATGKTQANDYYLQEVVADCMGKLLRFDAQHPEAQQRLVEQLAAEDPSTARKILDGIKRFLKKLVGARGAWQSDMQATVTLFENALKNAKQTTGETKHSIGAIEETTNILTDRQGNETAAEEFRGGTVAIDTTRYSLNSFDRKEQAATRRALLDVRDANGKRLYTPEQVDKYMQDALGIASMVAVDRGRLDYDVTDPEKSMVKPNADYGASIDASTLCAKRLLYQGTFDAIQHALPNTPLLPGDLINLANMMREMGYETPCGICYVESRRRTLGQETQKWLSTYEGEYKPKIEELTTSDGLETLRNEHPQAYDDFMEAMKKLNQRNPKVVQLRTEYRGEIKDMTEAAVQKAINHGGLRLQSFSDFETPHLLDMIQVVYDMASKALTSQAYTKVPNFAWAFGDTGIKINLSEIARGAGYAIEGGLSFKELAAMPYEEAKKLISMLYDDVEGMKHDEAMALRNRYGKNVGTIMVGKNDAHIIAAMGDSEIDFIIPFHRSGWTKSERNLMETLKGYQDYTNDQNERKILARKANGKGYKTVPAAKSKIHNFEPVGEKTANGKGRNGYWDFTKSGRENAEVYLQMCAEDGRIPKFSRFLVDNGDGSFSLPQGDDYRSTAIREGYWKTLIDFKMYDNTGVGSPQTAVTPNVNMDQAQRILNDYSLDRNGVTRASNNSLPVAQAVVDRFVEEYKQNHPLGRGRTRYSLPTENVQQTTEQMSSLDSVFDNMSLDELNSLLGTESEEEARNVQTNAVRDLKDEFDPTIYNGRLYVKPETLDHWLSGQGFASTDPNYAQAYITTMNPADFLRMTTATVAGQQAVLDSSRPLDDEELGRNAERQPIQLLIDESTGKITGHEGRHRAVALARAGVTEMPVLLFDSSTKYNKTAKDSMTLEGQNPYFMPDVENGNTLTFNDVIPLSRGNADIIRERFTASAEDEATAAQNGQRVLRYSLPSDSAYIAAVERGEGDEAGLEYDLQESDGTETHYGDRTRFSLRVKDQDELDFLNNQETITTYKTMQLINGHLYPPMAAIVAGNVEDYSVLGEWEKATEHPELIKNGNKFTLNKGKGKGSLDAAYNPYMHSSNLMINDQFSGAYNRPELVTVECEVPVSEDNGAYHAEFAKDSTGWHSWHTGTVAGQLRNQKNIERQVFLSRWIKPVRIIPDSEVAQHYADLLEGSDIAVPDNVVSPSLLTALKEAGVPIKESGRLPGGTRYSIPDDTVLERQIRQYLANGGSLNVPTEPAPRADRPQKQRQWGSARAERSPMLNDQTIQYLRDNSGYNPDTNQEQVNRAFRWIQSHASDADSAGYYGAVAEVESPDFDYRSADGQAQMLVLMGMAATQGDVATELRLADAYNRQGTDLGQQLQARKIFQMMTPLGRKAVLQKEAGKINDQYKRQGKPTRVNLSPETLEEAGKAKTPEEFDAVRRKAAKELASQMPANWKDKLTGWRMLSMLGNPRTHVRNVLGNALFMPAVGIKNKVGAVTEIVTGQKQRTKTLGFANKQARDFAKADAIAMRDMLSGDAKYKDGNQVEQERKAFGQGNGLVSRTAGRALQAVIDANGNALEWEDWVFLNRHYRNALAGYMTANKLKSSDMTGKTLDDARAYAVQEAQKATYRDANRVIEGLNKWEASHPGVKFFGNAILPFKKTPANILKRGVEYSPVGLINALTRGARQVKMWTDYQNGKLETLPDKAISPTQFIDKIASGLTGTGIMVLGAALSSLGAVNAGFDDDDEFKKLQGEQEYSLNLNLFGQDVSYTIDWAAPSCMPFFVGAAVMETYRNKDNLSVEGVLNDLLGITEPVFNLSMLDGVNSLLDVNQYAEGNAITQIGEKIVTNYATSFVPTFVGQVARTADTTRRKSYVESGADLSTFRYALEQVENKLPYLSTTNIPYRDVWGNPDTSGRAEAAIENFISPGYANTIKGDPVVTELERIYQMTGDPAVIPKAAGKTISGVKLNAEQYDQYVVSRGQTARETIESLMESPLWQVCDDPTRAKMISEAWTYATQLAQHEITGRKLDGWVMESSTAGNIVQTLVSRAADDNKQAYIAGYGQGLAEALDADNGEDFDTCMEALEDAGATPAEIRTHLRNYFKPLYQNAYMAGDEDAMDDIREKLLLAGVGFKPKDFNSWTPGEPDEEEFDTGWLQNESDGRNGASRLPEGAFIIGSAGGVPTGGLAARYGSPNPSKGGSYWDRNATEETVVDDLGRYGEGNIDLYTRTPVVDEDGYTETVKSFSTNIDGVEVLLPTVIDGRIVSEDEAVDHYFKTGEYLGKFNTPEEAEDYAWHLHLVQEKLYPDYYD